MFSIKEPLRFQKKTTAKSLRWTSVSIKVYRAELLKLTASQMLLLDFSYILKNSCFDEHLTLTAPVESLPPVGPTYIKLKIKPLYQQTAYAQS